MVQFKIHTYISIMLVQINIVVSKALIFLKKIQTSTSSKSGMPIVDNKQKSEMTVALTNHVLKSPTITAYILILLDI